MLGDLSTMTNSEHDSGWTVREAILQHLQENPDAADTLEGIVEWWIPEQSIRRAVSEVKRALATLEAEKLITSEIRQGRVVYRLPRN
jgi:hypothetical protein